MSMVEKKKHLFVVTLDSGKKTYFDFVDHNIYGVSGKVVQNFNTEAKRILKSKEDDNFLAMYFYERTLAWPCRDTLKKWPISLVETIYSLYGNRYSVDVLSGVAEFCYRKNFKLDKRGVKILAKALSSLVGNGNRRFRYLNSRELENKILEVSYSYLPAAVVPFITHADTDEIRNIVVEDAQKIAFRYEHENWDYLDSVYYGNEHLYHCVYRYIQLCNLLHHDADRNYQVELARLRMLAAKIKETEEEENSISTDEFYDGTGGVWQLIGADKWNYDCTGLFCSDCVYCNEDYCLVHNPMTEEERDIQIKSAKAKMKK